ncbi:hypothetical protein [Caballeronia sp. LZ043]|uniref:hypothetical protein n=1 Tax=Caballeronia sp. LZ043 TaxID=3038569 RepID=UPI0028666AD7|nr:hypothetical protein [Caballeronia sp. LZ043]MDR5825924.1 hypothetical protein [Caballeronia sp. LZ043]
MELTLKQFDGEAIDSTTRQWDEFLTEHEMFDLDYRRVLAGAMEYATYEKAKDNTYSYGVFANGTKYALAVVSVVHTPKPGLQLGRLKMLQVDLSPEFDEVLIAGDLEKRRAVLDIYYAAIAGTIQLGTVHASRVIKLYGRNNHLLEILSGLAQRVADKPFEKVSVSMQGRWLVIEVQI